MDSSSSINTTTQETTAADSSKQLPLIVDSAAPLQVTHEDVAEVAGSKEHLMIAESAAELQATHEYAIEVAGVAVQQIEAAGRAQDQYERGLESVTKRAMKEAYVDARTCEARRKERRLALMAECARFKVAGTCGEILYEGTKNPKPCTRPSVTYDPDGYCGYHRRRYGVNQDHQSAREMKRVLKERKLAAIRARRTQRLQQLLPELAELAEAEQASDSTPKKSPLLTLPAVSRFGRRKAKLLTGSSGHSAAKMLPAATKEPPSPQQHGEGLTAPLAKLAITASPPAPSRASAKNDMDGDVIMGDH